VLALLLLVLLLLPPADIAAKIYGKFTASDICCGFYKLCLCVGAKVYYFSLYFLVAQVVERGRGRAVFVALQLQQQQQQQQQQRSAAAATAAATQQQAQDKSRLLPTTAAAATAANRNTLSALPFVPHHGERWGNPLPLNHSWESPQLPAKVVQFTKQNKAKNVSRKNKQLNIIYIFVCLQRRK